MRLTEIEPLVQFSPNWVRLLLLTLEWQIWTKQMILTHSSLNIHEFDKYIYGHPYGMHFVLTPHILLIRGLLRLFRTSFSTEVEKGTRKCHIDTILINYA